MGVPMIKNCCFCASLHTGTLIIGYVYTVSFFLYFESDSSVIKDFLYSACFEFHNIRYIPNKLRNKNDIL